MNRLYRRFFLPTPWRRIWIDLAVLLVLHFTLVQLLSRARLLEHLLSPGPGSRVALVVTAMFLVLRVFVLVLLPGWFLARVWLRLSYPRPPEHD